MRNGSGAEVADREYLAALGVEGAGRLTGGELWGRLVERLIQEGLWRTFRAIERRSR